MHLTSQQIALAVAILVEVPSLFGLAVWAGYYNIQAMANIKLDSPYRWGARVSWQIVQNALKFKLVPRSEFTEQGLRYRRRALTAGIIFVLWSVVLMIANVMAMSWYRA